MCGLAGGKMLGHDGPTDAAAQLRILSRLCRARRLFDD